MTDPDNRIPVFDSGDLVVHAEHGQGRVKLDEGETVIVRFSHGLEECAKDNLKLFSGPERALLAGESHPEVEVWLKLQAEAIRSVNDMWGVFSPSRITLLPHQLWVCRKVLESWPTRWLIADDVGLGKTIEAGIILWPLLSRGVVRRLLVLCPAKLAEQWQYRLRTMFDIRLTMYSPEVDRPKADYWNTHNLVVASFHTLRVDRNERHDRLIEADGWDLVVVDEAHHFNYDEDAGPTLGYQLVKKLQDAGKITSLLFFTGTPHRGKNFGFLALLSVLRPDLFNPRRPLHEQIGHLSRAMIRNNKECVTDIKGKKLFKRPVVTRHDYRYSVEETAFYKMLSEFIATGKAYAGSLNSAQGSAVMLVLITMQKLASSSIAAIRSAILSRIERLKEAQEDFQRRLEEDERAVESARRAAETGDYDAANDASEKVVRAYIKLMADETDRLKDLLAAAEYVRRETKISAIIEWLNNFEESRSVLFFTEYKATQALLMKALAAEFGDGCVVFINGDGAVDLEPGGKDGARTIRMRREEAVSLFNDGKARFLVSTEAGGEGIDLQEHCHNLVHVDLPWNPMRLHQRVGRLNRYGQQKRVEVEIFRNPDTIESRIWTVLDEKIQKIMQAFGAVMEDQEDLMQLVLGMTDQGVFERLFFDAPAKPPKSFKDWLDVETGTLGGEDVVEVVQELVGNAAKFDFQQASEQIPKVDLPALKPFLVRSVQWNKRQVRDEGGGISFKTPESWFLEQGVFPSYRGLHFDRHRKVGRTDTSVVGVGHRVMDAALKQALRISSNVTYIPGKRLKRSLFLFSIEDRVTGSETQVRRYVVGVEEGEDGKFVLLKDWEVIEKLNALDVKRMSDDAHKAGNGTDHTVHENSLVNAHKLIQSRLAEFKLPFRVPEIHFLGALLRI